MITICSWLKIVSESSDDNSSYGTRQRLPNASAARHNTGNCLYVELQNIDSFCVPTDSFGIGSGTNSYDTAERHHRPIKRRRSYTCRSFQREYINHTENTDIESTFASRCGE